MILSSKTMSTVKGKRYDSIERQQETRNNTNTASTGNIMHLNVPSRSNSKEQMKSNRNPSRDSKEAPKEDEASIQKKKDYMLKCIVKIQSLARKLVAGNKYLEMQTK
jgi:hypothetical protein